MDNQPSSHQQWPQPKFTAHMISIHASLMFVSFQPPRGSSSPKDSRSPAITAPASMYHAVPFALMNTKAMNRAPEVPCPSRAESQNPSVDKVAPHLFLLLASLLLLQHLLDNLLLLDEEGSHNAVTDAATASRSTVGSLDGLLGLGDLAVLAGSESGNL